VKIRDIIKQIEREGWKLDRIKGSHRQFVHPDRPEAGTLTIAGHPSEEMRKGTLNGILKQAGLKQ
jgi:predicted RNA binding protein YcfA (HicA-like mRNA interferase family)